jgi:hypothetical protein
MFVGDMSSLFSLLTFLDPATLPGTDLPLLPRFPEPVLRACNFFFQKIPEPATFLPLFSKLRRVPEKLPQGLFFVFCRYSYEPATFLCILVVFFLYEGIIFKSKKVDPTYTGLEGEN